LALQRTNEIANPFQGGTPNPIRDSVIVWSHGRNGKSSEPGGGGTTADDADNIISW
jgi:hypothetical protein